MDRIHHSTAAASVPPVDSHETAGYPTAGNPLTGTPATILTPWTLHQLIEEMRGPVARAGITPDKADVTQLRQALDRLYGGGLRTIAASTELTPDDAGLVQVDASGGAVTVTLPAASSAGGRPITFAFARTDASTNVVTIARADSDTIEGSTSLTLAGGVRLTVRSNGVGAWRVHASFSALATGTLHWGGTAGGSVNARTVTVAGAVAYVAGLKVSFVNGAGANTGAATLDVSGLGAKAIRRGDGSTALAAGDLPASALVEVQYDGTAWRLTSVSYTAAQWRAVTGAMAVAGGVFTGGVGFGSGENLLYLGGAGERVWQWTADAADQIWFDPAIGLLAKIGNLERFRLTSAGAAFAGDLGVAGAGGVKAKNTPVAWVNFNGTGTVAIRSSFNVASITDNGTGNYTINFAAPLADAAYAWVGTCRQGDTVGSMVVGPASDTLTASALQIRTIGFDSLHHDAEYVSVAVFR